jgi:hypothetical protein
MMHVQGDDISTDDHQHSGPKLHDSSTPTTTARSSAPSGHNSGLNPANPGTTSTKDQRPGTDVRIFYCRKNWGKNYSKTAVLCNILIVALDFKENAIFRRNLEKIAEHGDYNIDPGSLIDIFFSNGDR